MRNEMKKKGTWNEVPDWNNVVLWWRGKSWSTYCSWLQDILLNWINERKYEVYNYVSQLIKKHIYYTHLWYVTCFKYIWRSGMFSILYRIRNDTIKRTVSKRFNCSILLCRNIYRKNVFVPYRPNYWEACVNSHITNLYVRSHISPKSRVHMNKTFFTLLFILE